MHLLSTALRPALILASALCAIAVSSPAHAQTPVRVVGRLVPVNGPSICMQGQTHLLDCSRVYLVSSRIDLNAFNGQVADLTGIDVGVTCRVLDIFQAQPATGTIDWSGNATLGGTITFTLNGPGMSFNAAFLGTGTGYTPIDLTLGTLLVGLPIYSLGGGIGIGGIQFSVTVPVDPQLVGFTAYIQSAHQSLGPVSPGFLGNPICFRIS